MAQPVVVASKSTSSYLVKMLGLGCMLILAIIILVNGSSDQNSPMASTGWNRVQESKMRIELAKDGYTPTDIDNIIDAWNAGEKGATVAGKQQIAAKLKGNYEDKEIDQIFNDMNNIANNEMHDLDKDLSNMNNVAP